MKNNYDMIKDFKKEKVENMAYNKKAQENYRKKSIQFAISYRPTDIAEGQRLKKYLEESGQSANSYLKSLVKKDMDSKGIKL